MRARCIDNGQGIFLVGWLFSIAAGVRAVQFYRANPGG